MIFLKGGDFKMKKPNTHKYDIGDVLKYKVQLSDKEYICVVSGWDSFKLGDKILPTYINNGSPYIVYENSVIEYMGKNDGTYRSTYFDPYNAISGNYTGD